MVTIAPLQPDADKGRLVRGHTFGSATFTENTEDMETKFKKSGFYYNENTASISTTKANE